MGTTAPKTTSKRIDFVDAKDRFVGEIVAGRQVTYKVSPYSYYGYRNDHRTIHLGENNETIKGTLNAVLDLDELKEFMAWVKKNCQWHKTKVTYNKPKQAILTGSFDLPIPEVTKATVESTFHRFMTKQFSEDLVQVDQRKADRAAKAKAATAARAAKRREEAAAARKRERERIKKQQEAERKRQEREEKQARIAESLTEFGDLATALKVLKKHGLKIVTIDDEGKVK